MIGRTLAHYRILEKAGAGAMGEVYRAEDGRLKRTVALKMLPDAMCEDAGHLARFHQEAETLAQLDHPNIVTIFSIEEADGVRFLTMAWIDGETLDGAIPDKGFALDAFFDIAIPLSEAMAAAHDQGIVHRDLKPANVMLATGGALKVLDFGLAKSAGGLGDVDPDAVTLTRDGELVGSLPYMAPEQVRGEDIDVRADVFALGTMLYELATGERPFKGASAGDLISSILRDSPPPVNQLRPELPQHLARIIRRCLHKEPDRRFQSAKGLRNDLADLRTEMRGSARAEVTSVAVLPFLDMSPERDQAYFCEGIAEEILNALAGLRGLHVAARTSSFQFRERALDVREIGQRLNVDVILDGSVRKAENRLRIVAQLVNVADGYHLWSERYDRELEDVFAIQDEIAGCVVQALELTLTPHEERAIKKHRAANLEAYDYYLRGRQEAEKITHERLQVALEMFRKAIEIDPTYAPAWAGLADAHSWLFGWYGSCEDDFEEADRASRRAVELAPDSADAWISRGHVKSLRFEPGAAADFERALELNPAAFDAYWLYGRHHARRGRLEDAAAMLEKAATIRPEDYQALLLLPQFYRGDNPARADEAARLGVERARRRLELNPTDARALYLSAGPLLQLGRSKEAHAAAERALAIDPEDPVILYNVACFFSIAGEIDRALECLEQAVRRDFGQRDWFEHDSDLDNVRSDPRFKALMEGRD
jgi:non-specific serine/threonine protein kinase